jgi:hypothetical protein
MSDAVCGVCDWKDDISDMAANPRRMRMGKRPSLTGPSEQRVYSGGEFSVTAQALDIGENLRDRA